MHIFRYQQQIDRNIITKYSSCLITISLYSSSLYINLRHLYIYFFLIPGFCCWCNKCEIFNLDQGFLMVVSGIWFLFCFVKAATDPQHCRLFFAILHDTLFIATYSIVDRPRPDSLAHCLKNPLKKQLSFLEKALVSN